MTLIPCEVCNRDICSEDYEKHLIVCILSAQYLLNIRDEVEHEYDIQNNYQMLRNKFPRIPVLEKKECPICLTQIRKDCRELSCGHTFCDNCIDEWWKRQLNCPMCKFDFLPVITNSNQ